ncbi:transposase, IS605 OrfB family, partial [mine drainage metagenome]
KIRYPYRDKRFFPLMWPAQAMGLEAKRIVLPMGRGRPSLIFRRPAWLLGKCACKVVWNGIYNELHISLDEADAEPASPEETEQHATVDLGQIHQAAVVTNAGEALVVSGRGIRSIK